MLNIKVLLQNDADWRKQHKAILDAANCREPIGLNDQERVQLDTLERDIADVQEKIRATRVEQAAEQQAVTRVSPIDAHERKLFVAQRKAGSAGRRFRELFANYTGGGATSGFTSFEEFMSVVHAGLNDPRLKFTAALSGHGEKFPAEGGFFVPEEFSAEMLDAALESEVIRPRARIYPMTTLTRKIAGWDGLDNSAGAPFGGFDIQWLDEGATGTTKKAKTRLIQLTANRCAIYTRSSDELIVDGLSFEEMLGEALILAVAWGLDDAFFNGNGAGKPKGVLTDAALIAVAKEASQAADTINYTNLTKMFARLHPRSLANAVWAANPTCIPQLLALTVVIQNVAASENVGGSHIPVVSESNGEFRILTRPVLFTEKLPVVGDQGDIILADFSQYAIGLRKEVSIEKSQHVGWHEGETAYRVVVRTDGQGRWSKPYVPKNGDTTSWIVALAERA